MTKPNPYWFFEKWGIKEQPPINSILDRLEELENRVKVLEEENIGLTNSLYEIANSLDARIDILVENCRNEQDV